MTIPLRHPQLLDPPSICPRCGRKAWQNVAPEGAEPEYECETCRFPNVENNMSDTPRTDYPDPVLMADAMLKAREEKK